jgi:hypothetical protein
MLLAQLRQAAEQDYRDAEDLQAVATKLAVARRMTLTSFEILIAAEHGDAGKVLQLGNHFLQDDQHLEVLNKAAQQSNGQNAHMIRSSSLRDADRTLEMAWERWRQGSDYGVEACDLAYAALHQAYIRQRFGAYANLDPHSNTLLEHFRCVPACLPACLPACSARLLGLNLRRAGVTM